MPTLKVILDTVLDWRAKGIALGAVACFIGASYTGIIPSSMANTWVPPLLLYLVGNFIKTEQENEKLREEVLALKRKLGMMDE